jgi:hypothetical protein
VEVNWGFSELSPGRVQILDPALQASNTPIIVSL